MYTEQVYCKAGFTTLSFNETRIKTFIRCPAVWWSVFRNVSFTCTRCFDGKWSNWNCAKSLVVLVGEAWYPDPNFTSWPMRDYSCSVIAVNWQSYSIGSLFVFLKKFLPVLTLIVCWIIPCLSDTWEHLVQICVYTKKTILIDMTRFDGFLSNKY